MHTFRTWAMTLAILVSATLVSSGCRQTSSGVGSAAPITTLPGQSAATAGPAFPMSPFGSGVRVPPPATGSFGAPSGVIATPGYAPPSGTTAPMSYNEPAPLDARVQSSVENANWNQVVPTSLSRSGGMPVIDLTQAAPQSGTSLPSYVAPSGGVNQLPSTNDRFIDSSGAGASSPPTSQSGWNFSSPTASPNSRPVESSSANTATTVNTDLQWQRVR